MEIDIVSTAMYDDADDDDDSSHTITQISLPSSSAAAKHDFLASGSRDTRRHKRIRSLLPSSSSIVVTSSVDSQSDQDSSWVHRDPPSVEDVIRKPISPPVAMAAIHLSTIKPFYNSEWYVRRDDDSWIEEDSRDRPFVRALATRRSQCFQPEERIFRPFAVIEEDSKYANVFGGDDDNDEDGDNTSSESNDVVTYASNTNMVVLPPSQPPLTKKMLRQRKKRYFMDERVLDNEYLPCHGSMVDTPSKGRLQVWLTAYTLPGIHIGMLHEIGMVRQDNVFILAQASVTDKRLLTFADATKSNKSPNSGGGGVNDKPDTLEPNKWFFFVQTLDGEFHELSQKLLVRLLPRNVQVATMPPNNLIVLSPQHHNLPCPFYPPHLFIKRVAIQEARNRKFISEFDQDETFVPISDSKKGHQSKLIQVAPQKSPVLPSLSPTHLNSLQQGNITLATILLQQQLTYAYNPNLYPTRKMSQPSVPTAAATTTTATATTARQDVKSLLAQEEESMFALLKSVVPAQSTNVATTSGVTTVVAPPPPPPSPVHQPKAVPQPANDSDSSSSDSDSSGSSSSSNESSSSEDERAPTKRHNRDKKKKEPIVQPTPVSAPPQTQPVVPAKEEKKSSSSNKSKSNPVQPPPPPPPSSTPAKDMSHTQPTVAIDPTPSNGTATPSKKDKKKSKSSSAPTHVPQQQEDVVMKQAAPVVPAVAADTTPAAATSKPPKGKKASRADEKEAEKSESDDESGSDSDESSSSESESEPESPPASGKSKTDDEKSSSRSKKKGSKKTTTDGTPKQPRRQKTPMAIEDILKMTRWSKDTKKTFVQHECDALMKRRVKKFNTVGKGIPDLLGLNKTQAAAMRATILFMAKYYHDRIAVDNSLTTKSKDSDPLRKLPTPIKWAEMNPEKGIMDEELNEEVKANIRNILPIMGLYCSDMVGWGPITLDFHNRTGASPSVPIAAAATSKHSTSSSKKSSKKAVVEKSDNEESGSESEAEPPAPVVVAPKKSSKSSGPSPALVQMPAPSSKKRKHEEDDNISSSKDSKKKHKKEKKEKKEKKAEKKESKKHKHHKKAEKKHEASDQSGSSSGSESD